MYLIATLFKDISMITVDRLQSKRLLLPLTPIETCCMFLIFTKITKKCVRNTFNSYTHMQIILFEAKHDIVVVLVFT